MSSILSQELIADHSKGHVTERGEKKGWAATYWAVTRAARRALARGQKAGGNTVAK